MPEHGGPGKKPQPYRGELSPIDAASAMQAARLNALDLLDTAEMLWSLKRFGHSVAFSILAIEEAGKFPILQMIFLGFAGEPSAAWKSYRLHRAKTAWLNLGIRGRVRATFPEISPAEATEIAQLGPTPDDLEVVKQRVLYSDCLQTTEGFACHLPRNVDQRQNAWERLCEAKALVSGLRDYPPEELEVWLKHARAAQAKGEGYPAMLRPLQSELLEKGFIKEGQWKHILGELDVAEKGGAEPGEGEKLE
jgi:AbiV family abortive infection protein